KATPFLYDTTVLYESPRNNVTGYESVTERHGFTQKNVGCPVKIDDTGFLITLHEHTFEIGTEIQNATHIIALSHVKGHVATGMGGAIKNLGMGGVTKESKKMMHYGAKPIYNSDTCTYCEICAKVCPFHAINVENGQWQIRERACFGCGVCVENCELNALEFTTADFQFMLALATKACVTNKRVIYINDVNRIARSCDCDPQAGPIICPDIGYLVSTDPVAIDTASLDLINKKRNDVFLKENHVNPSKQLQYGEELGLGSQHYELINL
ncbi:MAG: DUF362 domain-containing protein, partial [Candidatus Heimdallarchaeota archaeon]|nr:DUF362 domain-containing protein [Candidatus Heimdallarchaeota archaeon]